MISLNEKKVKVSTQEKLQKKIECLKVILIEAEVFELLNNLCDAVIGTQDKQILIDSWDEIKKRLNQLKEKLNKIDFKICDGVDGKGLHYKFLEKLKQLKDSIILEINIINHEEILSGFGKENKEEVVTYFKETELKINNFYSFLTYYFEESNRYIKNGSGFYDFETILFELEKLEERPKFNFIVANKNREKNFKKEALDRAIKKLDEEAIQANKEDEDYRKALSNTRKLHKNAWFELNEVIKTEWYYSAPLDPGKEENRIELEAIKRRVIAYLTSNGVLFENNSIKTKRITAEEKIILIGIVDYLANPMKDQLLKLNVLLTSNENDRFLEAKNYFKDYFKYEGREEEEFLNMIRKYNVLYSKENEKNTELLKKLKGLHSSNFTEEERSKVSNLISIKNTIKFLNNLVFSIEDKILVYKVSKPSGKASIPSKKEFETMKKSQDKYLRPLKELIKYAEKAYSVLSDQKDLEAFQKLSGKLPLQKGIAFFGLCVSIITVFVSVMALSPKTAVIPFLKKLSLNLSNIQKIGLVLVGATGLITSRFFLNKKIQLETITKVSEEVEKTIFEP